MICPDCDGKGEYLKTWSTGHREMWPCSTCNGSGTTHCCDGHQTQEEQACTPPPLPEQSTT